MHIITLYYSSWNVTHPTTVTRARLQLRWTFLACMIPPETQMKGGVSPQRHRWKGEYPPETQMKGGVGRRGGAGWQTNKQTKHVHEEAGCSMLSCIAIHGGKQVTAQGAPVWQCDVGSDWCAKRAGNSSLQRPKFASPVFFTLMMMVCLSGRVGEEDRDIPAYLFIGVNVSMWRTNFPLKTRNLGWIRLTHSHARARTHTHTRTHAHTHTRTHTLGD
jgi:hypothetical protein